MEACIIGGGGQRVFEDILSHSLAAPITILSLSCQPAISLPDTAASFACLLSSSPFIYLFSYIDTIIEIRSDTHITHRITLPHRPLPLFTSSLHSRVHINMNSFTADAPFAFRVWSVTSLCLCAPWRSLVPWQCFPYMHITHRGTCANLHRHTLRRAQCQVQWWGDDEPAPRHCPRLCRHTS